MLVSWYRLHVVLPLALIVLCILVVATGCVPDESDGMLFLQKPFEGRYQNNAPFDHDLPTFLREDGNVAMLTWRGEALIIGWDQHTGHDWGLPHDTPVLAAAEGDVVFTGTDDFGALVVILHHVAPNGEEYETWYLHLSRIDVQDGQSVDAGQQIGLSGTTGMSSGPHLHFEVHRLTGTNSGRPAVVDPFGWQGEGPDPWAQHPDGARSVWLWKRGQAPSGDYLRR